MHFIIAELGEGRLSIFSCEGYAKYWVLEQVSLPLRGIGLPVPTLCLAVWFGDLVLAPPDSKTSSKVRTQSWCYVGVQRRATIFENEDHIFTTGIAHGSVAHLLV